MQDTRITKPAQLCSTNQEGDEIVGDQGNDEHSEAGTGHWPNP